MKISVLIPVKNGEKTIIPCLESVLEQKDYGSNTKVEIVVVNSGSTDRTEKILERYSKYYKNIRVYNFQKDIGLAEAKNKCLQYASGSYYLFLYANDQYMPGALKNIVAALENQKGVELLRYKVKCNGFVILRHCLKLNEFEANSKPIDGFEAFSQWQFGRNIPHGTFFCWLYVFKATLFKHFKFPLIDKGFEDFASITDIIIKAKSVISIDYECYQYNYYKHPFNRIPKLDSKVNFQDAWIDFFLYGARGFYDADTYNSRKYRNNKKVKIKNWQNSLLAFTLQSFFAQRSFFYIFYMGYKTSHPNEVFIEPFLPETHSNPHY